MHVRLGQERCYVASSRLKPSIEDGTLAGELAASTRIERYLADCPSAICAGSAVPGREQMIIRKARCALVSKIRRSPARRTEAWYRPTWWMNYTDLRGVAATCLNQRSSARVVALTFPTWIIKGLPWSYEMGMDWGRLPSMAVLAACRDGSMPGGCELWSRASYT